MEKRYLGGLVAAVAVLGAVDVAHAAGSAATFRPDNPSDAANVYNNGNYLYNQSSAGAVKVVADLGIGTGSKTVVVYGWTQGNNTLTTCSIYYSSLTDSTNRGNSGTPGRGGSVGSWQKPSQQNVNMTVTSGTPPSGPTYSYQLVCALGAWQPGLSAEQIFAWN